ncbi:MAG: NAD(P)-dependent oxidoreductase [Rhizobiales bacterium]|nr:NAD(P)-dependent oxidoreductase [Hyphomicrobiales bacterium]
MSTMITGSSGFVGIALTEEILSKGEHVVGVDVNPPPQAAVAAFARRGGRFDFAQGSVTNRDFLDDTMKKFGVKRLVALAAVTADANRERQDPGTIIDVNVGGTIAAISQAAKKGVERVVYVSSGSVYGASGETAASLIEDETPQRPEGLYGISKQAAEAAALRLGRLYDIDVVAGRLGTCYGPWERETGFRDTLSALLQILRLAQRGEEAVLPWNSTRDWLYVRDGAAGLKALLDRPRLPHTMYNVAATFEFSTDDWCALVRKQHPGFRWRNAHDGEPANVNLYNTYDRASMRIARLVNDTGFTPHYDLAKAFADFQAWRTTIESTESSGALK